MFQASKSLRIQMQTLRLASSEDNPRASTYSMLEDIGWSLGLNPRPLVETTF